MGLGLFWKPSGPTSNHHLSQIKRDFDLRDEKGGPLKKGIGHTGTLDPFAEGWLMVGWGEGTKLLAALQKLNKTYEAEILLGASSETFDNTSTLIPWKNEFTPDEALLREFVTKQIGKQSQIPPIYSAKKINGQRSYDLARANQAVVLEPCDVEILAAEHLSLAPAGEKLWKWRVRVRVTSGTFIRAFARDWALAIFGESACLSQLRRIGIGNFERDSTEHVLFEQTSELAPFYDAVPTIQKQEFQNESLSKDRGAVLVAGDGRIEAAWIPSSLRWRHFNSNPLAR